MSAAPPRDPAWAVLHVLWVCGCADTPVVAANAALDVQTVAAAVAALAGRDLVVWRDGRMPGWKLTDVGRVEHARLMAEEMADGDVHAAVRRLHATFAPINLRFKETCTNWQLRDGVLNTHDDLAYDRRVVAALCSIHAELSGALDTAGRTVVAFQAYGVRFDDALGRFERGDASALARPLSGSYHDVWMELHQDLIGRLGLERGRDYA